MGLFVLFTEPNLYSLSVALTVNEMALNCVCLLIFFPMQNGDKYEHVKFYVLLVFFFPPIVLKFYNTNMIQVQNTLFSATQPWQ